ncbi:MAG: asparagine--tRNA ligase [Planctomycetota bacterium]
MEWVYINELGKYIGREVEVKGWLYNKRSKGKIFFFIVRDGTGFLQCVATTEKFCLETLKEYEATPLESSIIVTGVPRNDPRAPGGIEVDLLSFKVVSPSAEYPIGLKEHGIDFLMDNRHLWLRSKRQFATLRIRSLVEFKIREFFNNKGFVLLDSPILTASACEGTTTLFEVNYFDDKAYLSQSGQLYVEAGCFAFGKVYCFGPTFRAEKSKTRRHLTEFWMVEPEIAFADLDYIIKLAEELISYVIKETLLLCKNELQILERDTKILEQIKPPFPRITYTQALKILKEKNLELPFGEDFGAPHETALSGIYEKPVCVTHYPANCKAFYMKRSKDNPALVECVDILAPEGVGEIVGGSVREDNLEELEKRIEEYRLPRKNFEWYLDLRRYGSVPHGGFGLGVERFVGWICGSEHIRETIPFPRTIYRLIP